MGTAKHSKVNGLLEWEEGPWTTGASGLIRQVWHSDPWQCPVCQKQMRLIAVIDDPPVVEKILRHLNLWCGPAHFARARPPPSGDPPEPDPDYPIDSDPLPDYEHGESTVSGCLL